MLGRLEARVRRHGLGAEPLDRLRVGPPAWRRKGLGIAADVLRHPESLARGLVPFAPARVRGVAAWRRAPESACAGGQRRRLQPHDCLAVLQPQRVGRHRPHARPWPAMGSAQRDDAPELPRCGGAASSGRHRSGAFCGLDNLARGGREGAADGGGPGPVEHVGARRRLPAAAVLGEEAVARDEGEAMRAGAHAAASVRHGARRGLGLALGKARAISMRSTQSRTARCMDA